MSVKNLEESYLEQVRTGLPPDHPICRNSGDNLSHYQRVQLSYFNGRTSNSPDFASVLQLPHHSNPSNQIAVCLIENISPQSIGALGNAWDVPPDFFLKHASNTNEIPLWDSIMRSEPSRGSSNPAQGCIEGVFEHLAQDRPQARHDCFTRQREPHTRWGLQANSKISYCRVTKHRFYLVLVDLPVIHAQPQEAGILQTHLSLRVPYSNNRGGLGIPQLYSQKSFSAFDCFSTFLTHSRHLRLLFADHLDGAAIPPAILANYLATSLWKTNFEDLRQRIHVTAFKDVRRPNVHINDLLHDQRQELAALRAAVFKIEKWLLNDPLDAFLSRLKDAAVYHPRDTLAEVLSEAEDLYQFLMDTFQLLIGSISVLDSQTSVEEAKRSTTLTQLAALYLPLSLATSIFGMNVKEINDSPLSVWVVFVALAILAVGTALLLLGTSTIRHASRRRMQAWAEYLSSSESRRSAKVKEAADWT